MRLFLDICQGAGLSGAAGIRPFLPALLSGAAASADLGVDYEGTRYAFLESPVFLLAIIVLLVVTVVLERRRPAAAASGPFAAAIAGVAIGVGALLFAGSLADHGETSLIWLLPGVLCAVLGSAAARSLFLRVRARLRAEREARAALPVYADGSSLVAAGLALLIPPISVLLLALFGWLIAGGRRREGQKYAGLRILR